MVGADWSRPRRFYSYAWLENLAGVPHMRNADRIHPEWQERRVGETVLLHPATGMALARFERNHVYAFAGWYFVLLVIDANHTRFIARGRVPRGLSGAAYAAFIELPHFILGGEDNAGNQGARRGDTSN